MARKQHLDLRCVLLSDPSTLGAGGPKTKTRLESRIKKFKPPIIYDIIDFGSLPVVVLGCPLILLGLEACL